VVRTYKPTGNPVGRPKKASEVTSGPKDSIATRMKADDETVQIIHDGASVTQLATIFKMKPESLRARIISAGVTPSSKTALGHDRYHIGDVAPYIVKPVGDIQEHIKKMSHKDLPKDLSKEFWHGLNARSKYELEAGQLWPTEQVIHGFSEVAKVIRMFLLTLPDHLDRNTKMNPQQRKVVQDLTDGALESLRNVLRDLFTTDLSESDEEDGDADPDADPGGLAVEAVAFDPADRSLDPAWDL